MPQQAKCQGGPSTAGAQIREGKVNEWWVDSLCQGRLEWKHPISHPSTRSNAHLVEIEKLEPREVKEEDS